MQDQFSTQHCWSYSVSTVFQTMQNEKTWMHRIKVIGQGMFIVFVFVASKLENTFQLGFCITSIVDDV